MRSLRIRDWFTSWTACGADTVDSAFGRAFGGRVPFGRAFGGRVPFERAFEVHVPRLYRSGADCPVSVTHGIDHEEEFQINRARQGDSDAINWLLARYRERVVRLATHVLRRPGEAEDVAQEAFVRAFRNLHAYRGEGRFYSWLYQIVVRLCLDRQGLARWRREAPMEDVDDGSWVAGNAFDAVNSRVLVEKLLDSLSPAMRATLVLRELDGLEYEEIAAVLQIPIGRVRWRLHAARAKFQELWLRANEEIDLV